MTDATDHPPPTPHAPVNPHEDLERIASGAIALPVRVAERAEAHVTLAAPHDVTPDGERAIVAAVRKAFPGLAVFVTLDPKPVET